MSLADWNLIWQRSVLGESLDVSGVRFYMLASTTAKTR
jgi:hypothetical protein